MKIGSILALIIVSLSLIECGSNRLKSETQESPSPASIETIGVATTTNAASFTPTAGKNSISPLGTKNATQSLFAIEMLLSQNDYCPVPCIWGIIPGETTLGQAQAIFLNLGSPLVQTAQLGNQDFYESSFGPKHGLKNGASFQIILTVEDRFVKNMRAGISLINSVDASTHDEWAAYSPESVLRRYGIPSRIAFSLSYPAESGFPPNAVWYDMVMYFDDLDFIFEYSSDPLRSLIEEGETVRICPITDQFENVGIRLGKEPVYPPITGLTLENASSLSPSEFYDVLAVNEGCINLNSKAFRP